MVRFPTPGVYPYELDYVNWASWGRRVSLSYNNGTGTVIVPPASYLKLFPADPVTRNPGTTMTVSVLALDNAKRPLVGLPLQLVIEGGNARQLTTVTDQSGYASFSYQGTTAGVTDTMRVYAQYGSDKRERYVNPRSPPSRSSTDPTCSAEPCDSASTDPAASGAARSFV